MSTDTLTRPSTGDITTDRPDKAHIVTPRSALMEAMIEGKEVTALCGYRWIPSRDPSGLPVCADCKAAAARMGRSVPSA